MSFPEKLQQLIRADEPLAPLVWLGIGGPAQYFAEPTSADELAATFQAALADSLAVRILGDGSNVLIREAGFGGLVISLAAAEFSQLDVDETSLTCGAGAKLSHAVIKAVGGGLSGLEHLVGIPGTVGGAVVGNASAGGRDIGSVVQALTVLGDDGQIRTLTQDDAGFGHRTTALGGDVVLSVTFQLEQRDVTDLTKRLQKLWIARNSLRPTDENRIAMPFVDPDGQPTRDLIQNVGLSGIREGNASLHAHHPDYLVAHDDATSGDCLKLIERVREQVLLQTGVDLKLNLQIW
ncbi:MAG: UDP-N-acetylmuramate dehydrogenase [Planctomycetota bacterium]